MSTAQFIFQRFMRRLENKNTPQQAIVAVEPARSAKPYPHGASAKMVSKTRRFQNGGRLHGEVGQTPSHLM